MDTSQRGIDLIFEFEGTKRGRLDDGRYKAYLDTLAKPNVWTVYAGLTRGITRDTVITKEQGDAMFRKELNIYEDAVDSCGVELNQNEFDALVSFTYNCGVGAFNKSIRPLIVKGKRDSVPAKLKQYINAGGKPYNGLIRRRNAEASLFLMPMPIESHDEEHSDAMPQRVEEKKNSTTEAVTNTVKESTSMWSGVAVMFSTIWMYFGEVWNWVFGIAKEAGTQATSARDSVSGLDPMFTYFGVNMKVMLAMITIAAAAMIISRAIARRK
jgi:lysozyme